MRLIRLIEQGEGLWNLVGREIYDPEAEELVRVVSVGAQIHTGDPRGNYVLAQVEAADRDVTSLSQAEFDELPRVRVGGLAKKTTEEMLKVGAVLKAAVGGDVETCCPDCGDPGPHETNGDPVEPFLACRACGMHSAVQS